MKTRKQLYHEYLNSEEWGFLRSLAIARNKRNNNNVLKCVDCTMSHKSQYDVHHEQYPKSDNFYSDDNSSYHVVLCRECHEKRHNINNDDMMPVPPKKRDNDFLCSHGAFIACFPLYRSLYMDSIVGIDLGDYKLLFDLLEFHHNFGFDINSLISSIEKNPNIDNEIKKRFVYSVENFMDTSKEINRINDDIVKLSMKNKPTDSMALLVHQSTQKGLKKSAEIEDKRISDSFEEILNRVKKHKRKLKRLV